MKQAICAQPCIVRRREEFGGSENLSFLGLWDFSGFGFRGWFGG